MRYRWSHVAEPGQSFWLLKRNCALTPRQLACWLGALGAVSMGISAVFATQGAWLMLPFAAIESLALVVAYLVYARHAADYERIVLAPGRLVVERMTGGSVARTECSTDWVRIAYEGNRRETVRLIAGGHEVPVGRFVPDESKEAFVRELRASLVARRA